MVERASIFQIGKLLQGLEIVHQVETGLILPPRASIVQVGWKAVAESVNTAVKQQLVRINMGTSNPDGILEIILCFGHAAACLISCSPEGCLRGSGEQREKSISKYRRRLFEGLGGTTREINIKVQGRHKLFPRTLF